MPTVVRLMPTAVRLMSAAVRLVPRAVRLVTTAVRLVPRAVRLMPRAVRLVPTSVRLVPTAVRPMPTSVRLMPTAVRLMPTAVRPLMARPLGSQGFEPVLSGYYTDKAPTSLLLEIRADRVATFACFSVALRPQKPYLRRLSRDGEPTTATLPCTHSS